MSLDYYRKINGSYGKTQKETIASQIQQNYDKNYENTLSTFKILKDSKRGDTVYINLNKTNITNVVFDYNITKKTKQDIIPMVQKNMWIDSNLVKRGDYISYTNKYNNKEETYLIEGKVETRRDYDDCNITECNEIINFMNGIKICSYPAIITNQTLYTLGVTIGTLKEGSSKYSIVLPYNEDTKIIENDMRFIIGNKKGLIVANVDYVTQKGLINLICGECETNSNTDDLENNIADRWLSQNRYEITNNPTIINLNVSDTQQLTTTVTENGVEMVLPSIAYSSSDDLVATVDSNGVINAIGEGNVVITASYTDSLGNEYNANCSVNITLPVATPTYTYDFTYGTTVTFSVKRFQTLQAIPNKYIDGVKATNIAWDFSIVYTSPASSTSCPTMEITDTYIKVKNASVISGSCVITATERNTSNTVQQLVTFTA